MLNIVNYQSLLFLPPPCEGGRIREGSSWRPCIQWWIFHVAEVQTDWNMLQTIYESESCFSSDGVSGREQLFAQQRMHSMISSGKRQFNN